MYKRTTDTEREKNTRNKLEYCLRVADSSRERNWYRMALSRISMCANDQKDLMMMIFYMKFILL